MMSLSKIVQCHSFVLSVSIVTTCIYNQDCIIKI